MNPSVFLMLALLTPFGFCLTLLGPVYVGMCAALYIIYLPNGDAANTLVHQFIDPFYIVNVYTQAYNYWVAHMSQVGFFNYTLPLLVLPFAGIILSLWLTHKFVRKMADVFQVSVGLPD